VGAAPSGPVQTDPATSLPIGGQGAEPVDMNTIGIRLSPTLHDIRLADLLDEVVRTADRPIKYSVEDYGVVFSLKGRETPPLYFREIKFAPGTLGHGVRRYLGVPDGDEPAENLGGLFRRFFTQVGVDISPPKTFFYKDRQGILLVYATLADLDIIERVIAALAPGPQLNINAVFLELPKAEVRAFWEKFGYTNQPASSGGARTTTLTDSVGRAELRRWTSQGDVKVLGQSQITTLNGRQTQVSSLQEMRTIVTRDAQRQAKPKMVPLTTLDIYPCLTPDSRGVRMDLAASILQFADHPEPGHFLQQDGSPFVSETSTNAVPRIRAVRTAALVSVQEGQTAVLGGFTAEDPGKLMEEIPELADLPAAGPPFHAELTQTNTTDAHVFVTPAALPRPHFVLSATNTTDFLVFVTPVLIDPAGNPIPTK
jgi:type II secretory pathway component GspD/PulD (secretin)